MTSLDASMEKKLRSSSEILMNFINFCAHLNPYRENVIQLALFILMYSF